MIIIPNSIDLAHTSLLSSNIYTHMSIETHTHTYVFIFITYVCAYKYMCIFKHIYSDIDTFPRKLHLIFLWEPQNMQVQNWMDSLYLFSELIFLLPRPWKALPVTHTRTVNIIFYSFFILNSHSQPISKYSPIYLFSIF